MYSGIQAPFTKDRLNSHPTSPPSPGSWARPTESVTLVPRGTPLVPQCPAPPGPYPPRGPVETCGKMVSNVVHPRTNHNRPSYHHKQRIIHNYTLLLRSWMVPSPNGLVWSTLMCPKWLSESTMIAEKCGSNHGSCCWVWELSSYGTPSLHARSLPQGFHILTTSDSQRLVLEKSEMSGESTIVWLTLVVRLV